MSAFSSLIGLARLVREDWYVHYCDWSQPGFRAVAVYRFGSWAERLARGPSRALLLRLHRTMFRYVRNHYGIELPVSAVVGRRLLIGHQSGIVVHVNAVIGDDCLLRQNVTIGAASHRTPDLAPRLGRGVQVGCGAAILGPITVGDDARIGPNAVVMSDVPPGATVVVDPPRIIEAMSARAAKLLKQYGLRASDVPVDGRLRGVDVEEYVKAHRLHPLGAVAADDERTRIA